MNKRIVTACLGLALMLSQSALADTFTLSSKDIADGEYLTKAQEFTGFGCDGDNISPQLSWQGAPKGTEAFALMVHDPDAPTGSGWWHWQVINIPKQVNSLKAGAGKQGHADMPSESMTIRNDYGFKGFGGACPPPGHGVHRYQFTLYALSSKLDIPEGASSALTGYMVKRHMLAFASIEALYKRD